MFHANWGCSLYIDFDHGLLSVLNQDIELTTTSWLGTFTPQRHIISPLVYPRLLICRTLNFLFFIGVVRFKNVRYIHHRYPIQISTLGTAIYHKSTSVLFRDLIKFNKIYLLYSGDLWESIPVLFLEFMGKYICPIPGIYGNISLFYSGDL